MATLSQIIFNIKNLKAGGVQNQSIELSDRQYAFIINYYRALLIRREVEKGKNVKGNWIQNLGRVDFQRADKNECCSTDIEDCIIRSVEKVPNPIEIYQNDLITYVGTTDGNLPFQRTTSNRSLWDSYGKYTGKLPKWFSLNGYIYIVNPPSEILEIVNIQGVFSDPKAAEEFRTCICENGVDCHEGFDFEYPLPEYLLDSLYKLMMDAEFKFMNILPPDTLNDMKDAPGK